jgi:hypothetical protein
MGSALSTPEAPREVGTGATWHMRLLGGDGQHQRNRTFVGSISNQHQHANVVVPEFDATCTKRQRTL